MINLISQASTPELNSGLNLNYPERNFDIDAYLKHEADFFEQSFLKPSAGSFFTKQTAEQTDKLDFKQEPIGITEITALHQSAKPHYFIAPFLSNKSMQADTRWITCISTKNISKKECEELGINTRRFRVIRVANASDILWVTWEALAAGNSQCVLSLLDSVSTEESQQLQNAAALGSCHGVLLTTQKPYQV